MRQYCSGCEFADVILLLVLAALVVFPSPAVVECNTKAASTIVGGAILLAIGSPVAVVL
jgi:hypothetical protein